MTTLPNMVPAMACPPGEDPLVWGLKTIEDRAEAAGWDQPNQLHFLYYTTSAGMPAIGVMAPQLPTTLMEIHAADMLNMIAASVSMTGAPPKPPGDGNARLIGCVLVFECWSVAVDRDDPDEVAKVDAAARARELKDRPDSIETRVAMMCTVDGRKLAICRQRHREPLDDNVQAWTGRISDALCNLLATCTAIEQGHDGRV